MQSKEHSACRNSWTGVSPVGKDCRFGQSFFLCIWDNLYAHLLHVFCINIIFYYFICHIRFIRVQYMTSYRICHQVRYLQTYHIGFFRKKLTRSGVSSQRYDKLLIYANKKCRLSLKPALFSSCSVLYASLRRERRKGLTR